MFLGAVGAIGAVGGVFVGTTFDGVVEFSDGADVVAGVVAAAVVGTVAGFGVDFFVDFVAVMVMTRIGVDDISDGSDVVVNCVVVLVGSRSVQFPVGGSPGVSETAEEKIDRDRWRG